MPQLWTETIVTQYFWLVVILLGFYYFAVVKFIPQIAYTLKARRLLEAAGTESKKADSNLLDSSNSPKALLSSVLTPKTTTRTVENTSRQFESTLKAAILANRANWINKVGESSPKGSN